MNPNARRETERELTPEQEAAVERLMDSNRRIDYISAREQVIDRDTSLAKLTTGTLDIVQRQTGPIEIVPAEVAPGTILQFEFPLDGEVSEAARRLEAYKELQELREEFVHLEVKTGRVPEDESRRRAAERSKDVLLEAIDMMTPQQRSA